MVPAQQVQQAMAHQPAQFLLQAVPLLLGLTPCRLQRNDDVPQFDAGAFHPVAGVVEGGKRQHIRGACFLTPGAVQIRDGGVISETQSHAQLFRCTDQGWAVEACIAADAVEPVLQLLEPGSFIK